MNKTILTLTLVLLSLISNAQTKQFSFGFGASNADWRLSRNNINDSTNGFGTLGGNFNLKYEQLNTKNIGFFVQYNTSSIFIDGADRHNQIIKNEPDIKSLSYDYGNYNVTALNFGLATSLKITKGISLSNHFGTGFSYCKRPEMENVYTFLGSQVKFIEDETKALALNFNYQINFNFALSEKAYFILGTQGQWQSANLKINTTTYINNEVFEVVKENYRVPMSLTNLYLGLKFNL